MIESTSPVLLKTKITIPVPKETQIPRERLIDSITAGIKGRLTLVYAPAGFGKTTLLAQWAHTEKRRCAWLSLDEMDNDSIRFWRYFVHSLAEVVPKTTRERILSLSHLLPSLSIYSFLDSLVNELFSQSETVTIIIDDYHSIHEQQIHDSLSYFIDYLPPTAHIILSSRNEPPFPTIKWRAQNERNDIGMLQLQFNQDETELFCRDSVDSRLSDRHIEQLRLRTEGWITGLQLVTLSLRSEIDYERYIQQFSGDQRNVTDFLFHEVFTKLPADICDFLIKTSILQRMDSYMCDAVTKGSKSHQLLDAVKTMNLFLIPLDDKDCWFRYHHLFSQFLQGLFKKKDPEQWLQTNRLASQCFAERGFMDEALHHAYEARDFDLMQVYLERCIPTVLKQGELRTLLHWFQCFPSEFTFTPELSLLYAFILVQTGAWQQAEGRLDTIEHALGSVEQIDRRKQLQSGLLFVRSNLMFLTGDFKKWFAFIEGILDQMLPEDPIYYNFNYNITEPLVRRTPLGLKGSLSQDTESIGRMFSGVLQSHGWQDSLINLYVIQSLCEGFYEWNRLEESRELLLQIERVVVTKPIDGLWIPAAITGALLDLTEERTELAHDRVDQAISALDHGSEPHWLSYLIAFKTRLLLRENRLSAAKKQFSRLGVSPADKPTFNQEYVYVTLARLLGKQHKESEALRLLELLKPQSLREQLWSSLVEISNLQALFEYQRGQRSRAFAFLHEALVIGETNGYIRSFVDEGAKMKELLSVYFRALVKNNGEVMPFDRAEEYVRMLIESFPRSNKSEASLPSEIIEPLSDSERSILRYLQQGAANKQIARELGLSEGTIRVYLSRLYDKLGVTSRTQAVFTAQNLKLLD